MTPVSLRLLCVAAAIAPGASIGELRVTGTNTSNTILHASTPDGVVPVEARELHVTVRYPSGKDAPGDLLVFYEPHSHLYLWAYQVAGEADDPDPLERYLASAAVGVTDGRMVLFLMGHPNLFIRESSQQASSLDDAQHRSVADATAPLSHMERDTAGFYSTRMVEIGKAFAYDFYSPPGEVMIPRERVHVLQSSYIEGAWQVILQGQWKARVTLTKSYDLVKVERID